MPVWMVLFQIAAPAAPGGVFGIVRSAEDGRAIAGVRIETAASPLATLTDSLGTYRLTLPPGRHLLRFRVVGRVPVEFAAIVPETGSVRVDVDLVARVTKLAPLVVQGHRSFASASSPDIGDLRRGPDWARLTMPGQTDLASMLADLPGVAVRGAGVGTLHFQGGDADQYVVRLDGFPILAASHFAPASIAVNPDLIRGVHLRAGAPPAREGDWLSGTIDLESSLLTAEGDHLRGTANPTDVRQLVRGHLGAGGRFLLSGRRSFRNVMGDQATVESRNGYEDWLGSAGIKAGNGWARFLVYRNRNSFAFPSRAERVVDSSGSAPGSSVPNLNGLDWWGATVGASWIGSWHGASIELRGWRANAGSSLDWLSEARPLHLDSRFTQGGVRFDTRLPTPHGWLDFGTEWVRDGSSYAASPATAPAFPTLQVSGGTNRVAGYFEAGWVAGSWLRARAGVRATATTSGGRWVDPRLGLELHPLSSVRISLTAGRVRQFSQSMRNQESFLGSFMGFEIPAAVGAAGIPVATADNLTVSAETLLLPGLTIGASGYLRRFRGLLLVAPRTGALFDAGAAGSGTGRASGAEIRATFASSRFAFEGSFAVGSATRRLGNVSYRPGFQRSSSLALRATGRLDGATAFGVALHASGGQRTTLIGPLEWQPYDPLTGEGEFVGTPDNLDALPNSRLLPGALRLDVGVRREWRISGRPGGGYLTTSVTVDNILDRTNPVALTWLPETSTVQPVSSGRRALRFEVGWIF